MAELKPTLVADRQSTPARRAANAFLRIAIGFCPVSVPGLSVSHEGGKGTGNASLTLQDSKARFPQSQYRPWALRKLDFDVEAPAREVASIERRKVFGGIMRTHKIL